MDLPLVLHSTKHLCNLHCILMATTFSIGVGVGVNSKSCKRRSLWPPTKKGPLHPLNPTSHNMYYKKPPPPPPPPGPAFSSIRFVLPWKLCHQWILLLPDSYWGSGPALLRAGPQVGRLIGPKPVAWQGPVGFSPDDRNLNYSI